MCRRCNRFLRRAASSLVLRLRFVLHRANTLGLAEKSKSFVKESKSWRRSWKLRLSLRLTRANLVVTSPSPQCSQSHLVLELLCRTTMRQEPLGPLLRGDVTGEVSMLARITRMPSSSLDHRRWYTSSNGWRTSWSRHCNSPCAITSFASIRRTNLLQALFLKAHASMPDLAPPRTEENPPNVHTFVARSGT